MKLVGRISVSVIRHPAVLKSAEYAALFRPPRRRAGTEMETMNRRKGVLLVGGLLAGSLAVATVVVLAMALARGLDSQHCKTGYPTLISCSYTW